jgi:pantoate--beta-alanine ligase
MLILRERFPTIANRKKWSQKNLAVNVKGCAIFRESNGLAMSSRNERLSKKEWMLIYKRMGQRKIQI